MQWLDLRRDRRATSVYDFYATPIRRSLVIFIY